VFNNNNNRYYEISKHLDREVWYWRYSIAHFYYIKNNIVIAVIFGRYTTTSELIGYDVKTIVRYDT